MPATFEEAVTQVEKNTLTHLYPLWMVNWQQNLQKAIRGESLDKVYAKGAVNRVLIVGRGPSLQKHNHLDYLAQHKFPGEIVTSDGGLPLLMEHCIVPTLSITVDGSPLIAKWYIDDSLKDCGVHAVLPVTAHPETVKACDANNIPIYWYIPELDMEPNKKGVTETLQLQTLSSENPTGLSRLNGAGCSGLCSIVLAATIMRAKEIILIGMDNGYPADTPIEQLHYHTNILNSCGFNDVEAAKLYKILYMPIWGEYCILDPVFEIYRRTFLALAKQIAAAGIRIVNCTGNGVLVDDAVQCMTLEEYYKAIKEIRV